MPKRTIVPGVILLTLLLCIGVIAHAAPLPLVPGMTEATTEKPTEQTTKEKNNTNNTTKKVTEETKSETNTVASGDSKPINKLEERAKTWFATEQKDESSIDKLAYAAETTGGDYLARFGGARDALISKAKSIGEYGAESYRAAVDTLFGWNYSINKENK